MINSLNDLVMTDCLANVCLTDWDYVMTDWQPNLQTDLNLFVDCFISIKYYYALWSLWF